MLAGTAYFYNDFHHAILEMDIEEFSDMSTRELFDKILDTNATKVVVRGVSNNHQSEPSESIIFSKRY